MTVVSSDSWVEWQLCGVTVVWSDSYMEWQFNFIKSDLEICQAKTKIKVEKINWKTNNMLCEYGREWIFGDSVQIEHIIVLFESFWSDGRLIICCTLWRPFKAVLSKTCHLNTSVFKIVRQTHLNAMFICRRPQYVILFP